MVAVGCDGGREGETKPYPLWCDERDRDMDGVIERGGERVAGGERAEKRGETI